MVSNPASEMTQVWVTGWARVLCWFPYKLYRFAFLALSGTWHLHPIGTCDAQACYARDLDYVHDFYARDLDWFERPVFNRGQKWRRLWCLIWSQDCYLWLLKRHSRLRTRTSTLSTVLPVLTVLDGQWHGNRSNLIYWWRSFICLRSRYLIMTDWRPRGASSRDFQLRPCVFRKECTGK